MIDTLKIIRELERQVEALIKAGEYGEARKVQAKINKMKKGL